MCGIAGIWGAANKSDSLESTCKRMISAIQHRGPDSNGVWTDEIHGLALGHQRLSIQDLSEYGHQPMKSGTGRYIIVFNGEIYNFREIAKELRQLGASFSGHSDTEVLLAAIEYWGLDDAIKSFVGMFAFALWDLKNNTLTLCRDRMGEKPLYYGVINHVLYFSSELKGIEAAINKSHLNIDVTALGNFLHYGYIGAPFSIYKEINKLKPATYITFNSPLDASNSKATVYWDLEEVALNGIKNQFNGEREAIESLESCLVKNINRQLIADVNVGLFLSGGIDSSLVSALAQNESSQRINTYTIGFGDSEYNESKYAEAIAMHLGTNHTTMQLTSSEALDIVPDIATVYDEPFADSSQIPTYLVSKLAKRHVTVCLSGDGGDELFAGYNRYIWTDSIWKKIDNVPLFIRKTAGKALGKLSPAFWDQLYSIASINNKDHKMRLVGLKLQKLFEVIQQNDISDAYNYLLSFWPEINAITNSQVDTNHYRLNSRLEFMNSAMLADQFNYLPGDNLTKVDRASMNVALETRLPILSHEIIEESWRIPLSMKIQNNQSKWILRQILYKHVPQHLIDRPKMGFSVPIADWLRNELRPWAEDLFMSIESASDHLIDSKAVQHAWEQHKSGKYDFSNRLWAVLMFLSWKRSN